jgi:hypothetical protein
MRTGDEAELDALFASYREACPDLEASANFMPDMWSKIEARKSFWFTFRHLGRMAMLAASVVCLLLALLNLSSPNSAPTLAAPTYTDALAVERAPERTYLVEASRGTSPDLDPADER